MKRFFESGGALCAVVFTMALAALIGCSNPGGEDPTTPSLVGIRVEAAKQAYIHGQELDPDTITITGTYSDGSEKPIDISDSAIAGYDKTKAGNQTLTVTVEGKSAAFTVTVVADLDQAKEVLETALDAALNIIEEIVVSRDGSDVPQGVPWITPAQKEEMDEAIETAREAAASGNADMEGIVEILESLQEAEKEAAAAAEAQTGTKADWSYTVTFNDNGGAGTNPAIKTVATPDTRVGSLPEAPVRNNYVFSGWNTSANGTGSAFTGTTPVVASITVYAQWTVRVDAREPGISVQPRSATYTEGAAAAPLSVTAESRDGGELSYRWHRGTEANGEGAAISGATGSSYTPPTTTAGTVYYYAEVTNTNNDVNGTKTASIKSATAIVKVNSAPIVNAREPNISAQPRSATYTEGAAAAPLSVTAESRDGGELSYRWHNSADSGGEWTAISGAIESSYTPPTTAAGTVYYYVEVANTNNDVNGTKTASVNSATATVKVNSAPIVNAREPVINVQPRGASYDGGAEAAPLSVTAESRDGGELSYQWHSRTEAGGEWTAISGATGSSYTPSTAAAGTIYYYVEVANTNNDVNGTKTASINSATAAIRVIRVDARAPAISVQPRSAAYLTNEQAAALSVTAASPDGGQLSYRWHSSAEPGGEWTAISGAAGSSYTPPIAAGTVYYYVEITNTNNDVNGTKTASINSATAVITVTPVDARTPVISVQPRDAAYALNGQAAPLSVTVEPPADGGALSYQWHSRTRGGNAAPIPGATASSYTPSTSTTGTVYYYVLVTNTNNSVDGEKTAVTGSRAAEVRTNIGLQSFVLVWVTDGGSIVSDMPENLRISRELEENFVITAAEGLTDLQWTLNGVDLEAPRGTHNSIVIEAVDYPPRNYTLGLRAQKDNAPYSITVTFTVVK
jgi:uncharacterized repeat protein (TIGR02543 family)